MSFKKLYFSLKVYYFFFYLNDRTSTMNRWYRKMMMGWKTKMIEQKDSTMENANEIKKLMKNEDSICWIEAIISIFHQIDVEKDKLYDWILDRFLIFYRIRFMEDKLHESTRFLSLGFFDFLPATSIFLLVIWVCKIEPLLVFFIHQRWREKMVEGMGAIVMFLNFGGQLKWKFWKMKKP